MNIKKVDDKPMVIYTKEKTKLHVKTAPETKIKAGNGSTVSTLASAGAKTSLDQIEGGSEVYESYMVVRNLSRPVESATDAGRRLYRTQAAKETSKAAAKAAAKETAKTAAKAAAATAGTAAGTATTGVGGVLVGAAGVNMNSLLSLRRRKRL